MAIPSRVLGSGINSLSTIAICGDGNGSVTAAGTSAGDATTLTYVYNNIATTGSGAGVKLPPTEQGETITIINSGANALTIYPYNTDSTINGATSLELLAGGSAILSATSNTAWVSLEGYKTLPKKTVRGIVAAHDANACISKSSDYRGICYNFPCLRCIYRITRITGGGGRYGGVQLPVFRANRQHLGRRPAGVDMGTQGRHKRPRLGFHAAHQRQRRRNGCRMGFYACDERGQLF